jgi:hypothetical protein
VAEDDVIGFLEFEGYIALLCFREDRGQQHQGRKESNDCFYHVTSSRYAALFMASYAILFVAYVKGLLAVMAFAAKVSLGDLRHVHFVRALRHLEILKVATRTLQAFFAHVFFMAEYDRAGIFRRKRDWAASHFFRVRQRRQDHGKHETE